MKQILQNIANGETSLVNVPCPQAKPNYLLIQTDKSLVSAGTERMLVDFGKSNWIEKARSQPDKVKIVLDKVKTDGISATYDSVKSKLDQPLPLGYCNVGKVLNSGTTDFDVGTRIVSNGHHAEVVRVPKNLVAAIPDEVDDDFSLVEFYNFSEKSFAAFNGSDRECRLVGSNFLNSDLPLLRYDTNDNIKSYHISTDGLYRVVSEIDGRKEDYIILKDGTKVGRLDHIFKDLVNIQEAQIVQNKLNELDVFVVRTVFFDSKSEKNLLDNFQQRLGDKILINIHYVDKINRTESGKLRFVICNIT